jgi:hypothetical protein
MLSKDVRGRTHLLQVHLLPRGVSVRAKKPKLRALRHTARQQEGENDQ